jgi:hypothetical protein
MATKRYPSRIDIEVIVPMIIIGLLMGFIGPRWLQSPLSIVTDFGFLIVVGFLCVVAAKISLLRRGIWGSWGPRTMTTGWARLYKVGYVLMGIGALPILLFYFAMR